MTARGDDSVQLTRVQLPYINCAKLLNSEIMQDHYVKTRSYNGKSI